MEQLDYIIDRAKKGGASVAEAICIGRRSLAVSHRDGALETVEHSESKDVGVRIIVEKRQAFASSSDLSKSSLDSIVDAALIRAKAVPEDSYLSTASRAEFCHEFLSFDQHEEASPDRDLLIRMAKDAEDAAISYPGISRTDSTSASSEESEVTILTSEGFFGAQKRTRHDLVCIAVAGHGDQMQRDYDSSSAVYLSDLDSATKIGVKAAENTVQRLNPRKIKTGRYPVIYDKRLGSHHILTPFWNAISGESVANGSSFLKDSLGKEVFSKHINIVDDPHKLRGFGSRAFDGECLSTTTTAFVEDGILKTWALNLRTAGKLGLKSTGHASRPIAGPPGIAPSNLYIENGSQSLQEAFQDIKSGFYVTELMGFGINNITGDYSMGAAGFWVEDGQIAYPVGEVTIAGNLKEMFKNMYPLNDLEFKGRFATPSLVIGGMMVAGA